MTHGRPKTTFFLEIEWEGEQEANKTLHYKHSDIYEKAMSCFSMMIELKSHNHDLDKHTAKMYRK